MRFNVAALPFRMNGVKSTMTEPAFASDVALRTARFSNAIRAGPSDTGRTAGSKTAYTANSGNAGVGMSAMREFPEEPTASVMRR